jgi:glycosyltransferase involved in cell wall biosynthesis
VNDKNGFLVPVKSADALVAAVTLFFHETELARRIGYKGRQLAEEKYDVRRFNAIMLRKMGIN